MLTKRQNGKSEYRRCGLSVTELAIVLGIIGIILAGIWGYVSQVSKISKRQTLSQQMTTVVTGVRSLYAAQASISGGITTLMPLLITQNAIPSNMIRNGAGCTNPGPGAPIPADLCADTPWGLGGNPTIGTFGVCAWTVGPKANKLCASAVNTATPFFAIELSGVAYDDCLSIATRNTPTTGGAPGLLDVVINANSAVLGGNALPVPIAFATAHCRAMSNIDFVYQLRAPTF